MLLRSSIISLRGVTFGIMLLVSVAIYLAVANSRFLVCTPGAFTEAQQKTISNLDTIIDLGLKLTTALAGFGAAALIGFKEGVKLTAATRTLLAIGTVLLGQSALYAIWWRFGIAEAYLNGCFSFVTADRLQWRFNAHIYLFMLGLVAVGMIVVAALFRNEKPETDT